MKYKASRFCPKYKICAQSNNRVWLNKNSRLRNFYYLRFKFLKPKGRRRNRLCINNLKWTIVRNRIVSSLFRYKKFKFKRRNLLFKKNYFFSLLRKQQLKKFYGKLQEHKLLLTFLKIYNSQFSNFRKQKFINILEGRLDIILLRAKLVPTIFFSHQFINHNGIIINEKLINIPSYSIKLGDIIRIDINFWNLFYKRLYTKLKMRIKNTFYSILIRGRTSFRKIFIINNYEALLQIFYDIIKLRKLLKLKHFILILNIFLIIKKCLIIIENILVLKNDKFKFNFLLNLSLYLQNIICQFYYNIILNYYIKQEFQRIIFKLKKKYVNRKAYLQLKKNFLENIYICFYNFKKFFLIANNNYIKLNEKVLISKTNNNKKNNFKNLIKKNKLKIIYAKMRWEKYISRMTFLQKYIFPKYLKLKNEPLNTNNLNYTSFFGFTLSYSTYHSLIRYLKPTQKEERIIKRNKSRFLRKKDKRKYIQYLKQRQKRLKWWRLQSHWYIPKYLEIDYVTLRISFIFTAEENLVFYPFSFSFNNLINFLKN